MTQPSYPRESPHSRETLSLSTRVLLSFLAPFVAGWIWETTLLLAAMTFATSEELLFLAMYGPLLLLANLFDPFKWLSFAACGLYGLSMHEEAIRRKKLLASAALMAVLFGIGQLTPYQITLRNADGILPFFSAIIMLQYSVPPVAALAAWMTTTHLFPSHEPTANLHGERSTDLAPGSELVSNESSIAAEQEESSSVQEQ